MLFWRNYREYGAIRRYFGAIIESLVQLLRVWCN